MQYDEVFSVMRGLLSEITGVSEEEITKDVSLDELYLDELDIEELMMEAEEEFNIKIENVEEELSELYVFDDLVKYVLGKTE